jgi:hypothetical protein
VGPGGMGGAGAAGESDTISLSSHRVWTHRRNGRPELRPADKLLLQSVGGENDTQSWEYFDA